MACSIDFIEHLCSSLSSLGEVRYRKMMGDYVIEEICYDQVAVCRRAYHLPESRKWMVGDEGQSQGL